MKSNIRQMKIKTMIMMMAVVFIMANPPTSVSRLL